MNRDQDRIGVKLRLQYTVGVWYKWDLDKRIKEMNELCPVWIPYSTSFSQIQLVEKVLIVMSSFQM